MRLKVLTVTGKSALVDVPAEGLQLPALREAVAKALVLPLDRLKLVKDGAAVGGAEAAQLEHGDSLLAVVVPRAVPQSVRDMAGCSAEEDDDAVLRLRLPANAPAWQHQLAAFLQGRLPEFVVAALFSLGWKVWGGLVAWMALSRVAALHDLGPPFIIATVFVLVLTNLGTRSEGSLSAYSIFNANARRLPGQLTAETLDGQLRHGQM